MTKEQITLCGRLRQLGYAQDRQVRLYGEVFELVSDPISVGDTLVFVDAREQRSGEKRRVRIPITIVEMAKQQGRAALRRREILS
jgi:hypothetical protein